MGGNLDESEKKDKTLISAYERCRFKIVINMFLPLHERASYLPYQSKRYVFINEGFFLKKEVCS